MVVGKKPPQAAALLRRNLDHSSRFCTAGHTGRPGRKRIVFSDYHSEKLPESMELFNPYEKQLEGRRFFILDKDEKNGEFFEVKQQESRSGKIVLEKALKHSYKKAGTKIYECSMARADRDGNFTIPLKIRARDEKKILCRIREGEKVRSVQIFTGQQNKWNPAE